MVYLDRLRDWGWRLGPSCHLIADTPEELGRFGARLGLKRAWLQGGRVPHFDLTAGRREKALRLGAVALADREFVAVMRRLRGDTLAKEGTS